MGKDTRDRREYTKKRYNDNKEVYKLKAITIKRTRDGMVGTIYQSQKQSCKRRGHLPPSYTLDELRSWMYAQDEFESLYSNWVLSDYKKMMKPSIDRIDDYKSYSFDNIQLMTWKENDAKGSMDIKNGTNKKKFKRVLLVEHGIIFEAIKYAQEYVGCSPREGNIVKCCKGDRKTAYGYTWRYADETSIR